MQWNVMQGLLFGLIAGIALAAFFYYEGWGYISFILIPIGAIMGVAPQLGKNRGL